MPGSPLVGEFVLNFWINTKLNRMEDHELTSSDDAATGVIAAGSPDKNVETLEVNLRPHA